MITARGNDTDRRFAANVKTLRTAHNLTQQTFADRFGMLQQTLARIEKGQQHPSLDFAAQVAKNFDLSLDALVLGTITIELKVGPS